MGLTTLDEIMEERRKIEDAADEAMKGRPPMPASEVADGLSFQVYEGGGQHRELCVSIVSTETSGNLTTTVAAMDELVAEWLKLGWHLVGGKVEAVDQGTLLAAMKRLASNRWFVPGATQGVLSSPRLTPSELFYEELDLRLAFARDTLGEETQERTRADERDEPAEQNGDAGTSHSAGGQKAEPGWAENLLDAMKQLASDKWMTGGGTSLGPHSYYDEHCTRIQFAREAIAGGATERSRADERDEPAEQNGDAGTSA